MQELIEHPIISMQKGLLQDTLLVLLQGNNTEIILKAARDKKKK